MTDREQWSVAEVAAHLGIKPRTVTAYHARGQMPPADGYVGRSPWWWSTTIEAWRTPAGRTCRYCGEPGGDCTYVCC